MKRVYFRWANQYGVASMETEDADGKRWQSEPAAGELVLPIGKVNVMVQKGQAIIDDSMTMGTSGHTRSAKIVGSDGSARQPLQLGKIQMNITPHADTDGVIRIGWNTMISYLDTDASVIKTADTTIGGDMTTNTLLHLCELAKYGKLVIKEFEINGSTEAVFAATAPSYVSLNLVGESRNKKMPFPPANSKDTDNTIRVYSEKYLSELGVELVFGGQQYLKITTPKTLSSIATFTLEYYPNN